MESSQSCHLSWVGREHERTRASIEFLHRVLKRVEAVGIKYDREAAACYRGTHELNRVRVARETWPDRNHGLVVGNRLQTFELQSLL